MMPSAKRRVVLAEKLGQFLHVYGRKAQKGVEPNDRQYDRKIEELMKHLSPEELSELISGDDESMVVGLHLKKRKSPSSDK
jgi:hypothetical protein